MALQLINIGTGNNTGDGEGLRPAGIKINDNFVELYAQAGHASYTDTAYTSGSPFVLAANTDTILPINGVNVYDSEKPNDIVSFYFSGGLDLSSQTGTFTTGESIAGGTSLAVALIKDQDTNTIEYLGNIGNFVGGETITGATSGATATISALRSGYITGRNNDDLSMTLYFKAEPSAVDQWIDVWLDLGSPIGERYRETKNFPKGAGSERGVVYDLSSLFNRTAWEANGAKIYVRSNNTLDIYDVSVNFKRTYKAR